jgi:hypothetical protein
MKNIITPDNNRFIAFSGKQDEKACNDLNSCVMEIHLQLNLPRPFSRFNYGNYTVRLGTAVFLLPAVPLLPCVSKCKNG